MKRVILFYISANLLNVRLNRNSKFSSLSASTFNLLWYHNLYCLWKTPSSYVCKQIRTKKANVLCYKNRSDLADLWERAQGPPRDPRPYFENHCSILCSHNTLDRLYHLNLPHSIRIICSFSLLKFLKAINHELLQLCIPVPHKAHSIYPLNKHSMTKKVSTGKYSHTVI